LDRHLHAGAEAPGRGDEDLVDGHADEPTDAPTDARRTRRAGSAARSRSMGAMSLPRVVAVEPGSAAARAGLLPGDEIITMSGRAPRDIIEYRFLADEPDLELEVARGGLTLALAAEKAEGEPLGAEISSALFDRIQTCDNHCEFCFIYQ